MKMEDYDANIHENQNVEDDRGEDIIAYKFKPV